MKNMNNFYCMFACVPRTQCIKYIYIHIYWDRSFVCAFHFFFVSRFLLSCDPMRPKTMRKRDERTENGCKRERESILIANPFSYLMLHKKKTFTTVWIEAWKAMIIFLVSKCSHFSCTRLFRILHFFLLPFPLFRRPLSFSIRSHFERFNAIQCDSIDVFSLICQPIFRQNEILYNISVNWVLLYVCRRCKINENNMNFTCEMYSTSSLILDFLPVSICSIQFSSFLSLCY